MAKARNNKLIIDPRVLFARFLANSNSMTQVAPNASIETTESRVIPSASLTAYPALRFCPKGEKGALF